MIAKLNALADRLVARVVPQATASACPHTYYQYKCVEHSNYRRLCYRDVECFTTNCSGWVYAGGSC
jgi:hypothetical protein